MRNLLGLCRCLWLYRWLLPWSEFDHDRIDRPHRGEPLELSSLGGCDTPIEPRHHHRCDGTKQRFHDVLSYAPPRSASVRKDRGRRICCGGCSGISTICRRTSVTWCPPVGREFGATCKDGAVCVDEWDDHHHCISLGVRHAAKKVVPGDGRQCTGRGSGGKRRSYSRGSCGARRQRASGTNRGMQVWRIVLVNAVRTHQPSLFASPPVDTRRTARSTCTASHRQ